MIGDAESWSFIDINKTSRRREDSREKERRHTFLCVAFILIAIQIDIPRKDLNRHFEPATLPVVTFKRSYFNGRWAGGGRKYFSVLSRIIFDSRQLKKELFRQVLSKAFNLCINIRNPTLTTIRYQSPACARRPELEGIFGCAEKLSRTEKLWNHFLNSIKPSKRATPKAGNVARQSSKCLFCYLLPSRHNSA